MSEVRVTFVPSGQSVFVLPGTSLVEAAGMAGIILQMPCGGKGTCGKCRVKVISGTVTQGVPHEGALSPEQAADGYCLACQSHVDGELKVEIPAESMFEHRQQILEGDAGTRVLLNPLITKTYFSLPQPTSEDSRSDLTRLLDEIGDVTVPAHLVRRLPGFLRHHDWQGTAVLSGDRLMELETGDTTGLAFGVAFDVGTTTVVGTLFDLLSGGELGVVSRMNGQIAYGDDVVSRIMKIRENALALPQLQEAIVSTLNDIIGALCEQAGVATETIYEIAVAGNATMQQILCGLDPSALGEVPFVQVFDQAMTLQANKLGLRANASADLFVMPQIGGFVGGDTVAGMVASRINRRDETVLLVDIGTNGEIVLCHEGRLMAASAAAGPAFEGARITQGMRATAGAIEKVLINHDVQINVIGNVKPVGMCGTALIDAAAGMLRAGVLDDTGRILPAAELPAGVSDALVARLVEREGQTDFLLVAAHESGSGQDIYVYQKDIRELQLASGAIRAAINILLRRAGVEASGVGLVLLAGAFGNFIRRSNARRIGLLPQVPCDAIRFIGNAASLGAKLTLMSANERVYADEMCRVAEHVDLSLDPEFQMEFGMAMMFPDSDVDVCEDD